MEFKANLTVNIRKQGGRYIAYSPALDLATSGKTEAEAKRRFGELVPLFIEELEEAGTTTDVLGELGWQKGAAGKTKSAAWMPPSHKSEEVAVRIPVAA
jgi:predicted RNase H-like HicB family nuclease